MSIDSAVIWEIPNAAPVITITGDSSVQIAQGSTYTELGATATDAEDGDITASVNIGGATVDTGTLGQYQVVYSVTDSGGTFRTKRRFVNVISAEQFAYNQEWLPGGVLHTLENSADLAADLANGVIYEAEIVAGAATLENADTLGLSLNQPNHDNLLAALQPYLPGNSVDPIVTLNVLSYDSYGDGS